MQPMEENQISVTVRCTGQPGHPGTIISNQSMPEVLVKAVVYLSNVTQIVVKTSLSEERIKSVSKQLASQGFDSLLDCKIAGKHHLVLSYSNSDKVQPTDLELLDILSDKEGLVNTHCTLITLVGESSNQQWKGEAVELVDRLPPQNMLATYLDENNDRLSLLVKSENGLKLCQQLHQQLIE